MRALVVCLIGITCHAHAAVSQPDITEACYLGDIERLVTIRTELPNDRPTDILLIAYLDWRLGNLLLAAGDKDEADRVLRESWNLRRSLPGPACCSTISSGETRALCR